MTSYLGYVFILILIVAFTKVTLPAFQIIFQYDWKNNLERLLMKGKLYELKGVKLASIISLITIFLNRK